MTEPSKQGGVDVNERVHQLLAMYGDATASVGAVLCDRHPSDAVAYTVVGPDLKRQIVTYGELQEASLRVANALAELGVRPGDRVATLMGKSVELLTTLLAIWRLGAVQVPLFTAFAPPAIAMRLVGAGCKVVVCDADQRVKLQPGDDIPANPPWQVVVVAEPLGESDVTFSELRSSGAPPRPTTTLGGEAPIIQTYTSGTTGRPKAVVVPTVALASFHAYMEFGFDLRSDDVFWNAADPGWAYGLYFGVIGSLCLGVPSVLLQGGFSPECTIAVLSDLGVTNFAAAPTVYRSLRASGLAVPPLALRRASAAGEPLTPEINVWARDALGVEVHDHFGQTEAGMLISNHHHPALRRPLKPGSMGHAMPGWKAVVLANGDDSVVPPGVVGRIAIDVDQSPLHWFTGYQDNPAKTAEKFSADGRWYLTGDAGCVDDDGYFHFLSRDDDVIIMAGYRIGPFDVESVLLTHPAVAEAAVVAAPDQLRGEVLEAFIVVANSTEASASLADELKQLVKDRYAAHAYPRQVHFVASLPKTPSGKIQRFELRQQRREELERDTAVAAPSDV